MANERAYLYCATCHTDICLFKHMGDAFYRSNMSDDAIDEFLVEHAWCGDGPKPHLPLLLRDGDVPTKEPPNHVG